MSLWRHWDMTSAPPPVVASPKQVVCLPGFGDPIVGQRWPRELGTALGVECRIVEWPGLWTRCAEPASFSSFVSEVESLVEPGAVLVGHSLGGRVALEVARNNQTAVTAVALCSPAVLGISTPDAVRQWREAGCRPTQRVASNGVPVTFDLPVSYLDELEAWDPGPRLPDAAHLLVFGGADPKASHDGWDTNERTSMVEIPGCEHRFMDDDVHRAAVVEAVAQFIAGV